MPRRVSWLLKAADANAAEADEIHKMRYRLLVCNSEACSEASELKCVWRGKMVTCLESQHASIFEYGEHHTMASTPARKKLTTTQKAFCRELAENHLQPMRIRHALARKFSTPLEELPTLKTVQNFVSHHGRTQMQNHDRVDELRAWIRERAYNGSELTNQAFTFAWEMDNTGKPIVCNGSDEKPFLVGLSTKALMLRLMKHLIVRFAMADGDKAQCNALAAVFGDSPAYCFLMCFFHVMKKVQEHIKGLSSVAQASILRDIYDLHFENPLGVPADEGRFCTAMGACCQDQSISVRAFEFVVLPTTTLARRVSELMRAKLLGLAEGENVDGSIAGSQTTVQVVSLRAPRVIVAPNRRSEEVIAVTARMGANYARMEVEGQPWGGWAVDVERQWCPCNYWFVFGSCIHVLFALRSTASVDSRGHEILIDRRKHRRGRVAVIDNACRPRSNGPALTQE
ncbi:hypothetical protein BBJ28_00020192 [Nothophytophthora sp. Chile5]|nr:hypothetical protein BBJ28_00020192 [Nothophytophthora sp. Chile5]